MKRQYFTSINLCLVSASCSGRVPKGVGKAVCVLHHLPEQTLLFVRVATGSCRGGCSTKINDLRLRLCLLPKPSA